MSNPAEAFLSALRAAGPDGALGVIATDADGFAAALRADPEGLGQAIAAAGGGGDVSASVVSDTIASAAYRRDGRLVASDPAFAAIDLPSRAVAEVLRTVASPAPRLSAVVDDASGRPIAVASATANRAMSWPLGAPVRKSLEAGVGDFVILAVRPAELVQWSEFFRAWTFTPAEARLADALVRTGNLREAASEARVSYETARETLTSAMAKTGARRQPEFVRQLTQLAFGGLPSSERTWRTLADTFDLSPRQGRLAVLVALGAMRGAAAQALGISEHTAKADLKVIYERCGVAGGVALARLVAETDALARLATATDVEILRPDAMTGPLRFVRRRRSPGRIAVEDHGPRDGKPVVVFHAPLNGRHLPRVLVAAMHAKGLRPISVERPGFGLTSPGDGDDFVADANADLIDVLDALGLKQVRLLGRSVAMPFRFADAHADRVEGGVLLAASPPGVRAARGLIATAAALALDHPTLIEGFARMMVRLSSERAILQLSERALANSPADLAALSVPQNRVDWVRASRQSSSGDGFSREYRLHADGGDVPQGVSKIDWTVLIGAQDPIGSDPRIGRAQWLEVLPGVRVHLVEDGGRLLHLSHPDIVADALAA